VTICIAASCVPPTHIVAVSDKMLSDPGDVVPAIDDAAFKNVTVAKRWGLMFSGNSHLWFPFHLAVTPRFRLESPTIEAEDAMSICREEYDKLRGAQITSLLLSVFGYVNIGDFMNRGRNEMGDALFENLVQSIRAFDLALEVIMYGFDYDNMPRIFTLTRARLEDCTVDRFAVLGTGTYMAASVVRKRNRWNPVASLVYGLLDAKFSSESASGVGRSTQVRILSPAGGELTLSDDEVQSIRDAWEIDVNRADPAKALGVVNEAINAASTSRPKER
jgi:hypothetical protein